MYEGLTYAEIKALPDDQKATAWRELNTAFPDSKQLTQKLGVAPIVVINNLRKYVENKPIGRASIKVQLEKAVQEQPQEIKPKRKYNRKPKENTVIDLPEKAMQAVQVVEADTESKTDAGAFSIVLKKIVNGEDARFLLCGIGKTLLKDKKYNIEVKLTEK